MYIINMNAVLSGQLHYLMCNKRSNSVRICLQGCVDGTLELNIFKRYNAGDCVFFSRFAGKLG